MPSYLPLHDSVAFTDAAVAEIALDAVNELIVKPIGGDIYIRLDGVDPSRAADDWFIPAGVPEVIAIGHAVTSLKVIGETGDSGTVKVIGSRNAQDNQY